jgi:hypothetical protein
MKCEPDNKKVFIYKFQISLLQSTVLTTADYKNAQCYLCASRQHSELLVKDCNTGWQIPGILQINLYPCVFVFLILNGGWVGGWMG